MRYVVSEKKKREEKKWTFPSLAWFPPCQRKPASPVYNKSADCVASNSNGARISVKYKNVHLLLRRRDNHWCIRPTHGTVRFFTTFSRLFIRRRSLNNLRRKVRKRVVRSAVCVNDRADAKDVKKPTFNTQSNNSMFYTIRTFQWGVVSNKIREMYKTERKSSKSSGRLWNLVRLIKQKIKKSDEGRREKEAADEV